MKTALTFVVVLLSSCGSVTNSIPKEGAATATPETPQTAATNTDIAVELRAIQGGRVPQDAVTLSDNRSIVPLRPLPYYPVLATAITRLIRVAWAENCDGQGFCSGARCVYTSLITQALFFCCPAV